MKTYAIIFCLVTFCNGSSFLLSNIVASVSLDVLRQYDSRKANILYHKSSSDLGRPTGEFDDQYIIDLSKSFSRGGVATSALCDEETNLADVIDIDSFFIIPSPGVAIGQSLRKLSGVNRIPTASKWLIFLDSNTSLSEFFTGIYVPLDCEFIVAHFRTDLVVALTEVYHINPNRTLQIKQLGTWTTYGGLSWTNVSLYRRRGNLEGEIFTGAYFNNPYVYLDEENGRLAGYQMEYWRLFERTMNFTLDHKMSEQANYGVRTEDGMWNGITGMLNRTLADASLHLLIVSRDRLDVVDHLDPLRTLKYSVYIKKPEVEFSSIQRILSPLTPMTWTIVCACAFVFVFLLLFACSIGKRYTDLQDTQESSILDFLVPVLGIFCQQGQDIAPNSWPCRLITFTAYLTAITMFVAYTATFISFLTVTHYHMPFKDFQGILDDGTYRLGILASAASINYFKFSPDAVLRQIYQKLLRPYVKEHPLTDFDGLKKLCTEKKYAYITMDVAYRHIVTKLPCETVHVPNAYFGMLIATTLRKNHPFRRVFDLRVCELLAAGIVQRIEENAVPRKMTENIEDQDTGATLEETFIIFLILIIGVCISVLILFIEIVTLKL